MSSNSFRCLGGLSLKASPQRPTTLLEILWIYVVRIVPKPRAGRLGVRIPARVRNFFSISNRSDWNWGPASLLLSGHSNNFSGVKHQAHNVNHVPPTAEIKNEWSYASILLICLRVIDE